MKECGKSREYTNCAAYGKKVEIVKALVKGELIHVFSYFKKCEYKILLLRYITKLKRRKQGKINNGFFRTSS
ncbi:hypothetical protein HMPREF1983_01091 [Gemella bergeri ATCC 700627]|uniref:Uncharacterized protein n=1 Tax=Gemella bergeri ATCC 700627 TaxID=1321820 RepID=U2S437_9BACL|nr:hypothetical protein HMPREF1983_01091 [Gemella bergeri ATCC 700627]